MKSRTAGVLVFTACADVFAGVFWPGPVNGLTLLTILLFDVVLLFVLLAMPRIAAATREMNSDLAATDRAADERAATARERHVADQRRDRDDRVFETVRGGL